MRCVFWLEVLVVITRIDVRFEHGDLCEVELGGNNEKRMYYVTW